MEVTIIHAQLLTVMAIWLALMASVPNQPIMMVVPIKADDSKNICEAMGVPMRTSVRTCFQQ